MGSNIEFPEQHKPLYCFKIIEQDDSIDLIKYKIFRYEPHNVNGFYYGYKFEGGCIDSKHKIESVRSSKLDRIVNKKFFTFNPDPQRAHKAFDNYFKGCCVDASIRLSNAEQRYNLWREWDEQQRETASNRGT